MKTSILDDLDLPEDRAAALRRESVRTGKPVNQLIKERLLAVSEKLVAATTRNHPAESAA